MRFIDGLFFRISGQRVIYTMLGRRGRQRDFWGQL